MLASDNHCEQDKITLLKDVGKRPEQGVHITNKRCAELDEAARLRLDLND